MTNLTSEQYRDVLKHVKDYTEKIPTVQQLVRKATETFYKRFGGYPEIAGVAPGKLGLFGEQTQFDGGVAVTLATPLVTIMIGRKSPRRGYAVLNMADVGKPHKITFSSSKKRPLKPGFPAWLNYIKGVMSNYEDDIPWFESVILSTVPFGVGVGSSASLEVAVYTFLEILVGKKAMDVEKVLACQQAEHDWIDNAHKCGDVERMTSVKAADRKGLKIDCALKETELMALTDPDVCLLFIDTHLKDELEGFEYSDRTVHYAKACEMLEVETLQGCVETDLEVLDEKIKLALEELEEEREEFAMMIEEKKRLRKEMMEEHPEEFEDEEEEEEEDESLIIEDLWDQERFEVLKKRVTFYIMEVQRIEKALQAWSELDFQTFGRLMKESHASLRDELELSNEYLDYLAQTELEEEDEEEGNPSLFGCRATGMGLATGGGLVALVKREKVQAYVEQVLIRYEEHEETALGEFEEEEEAGETGEDIFIKKEQPTFYIITPFLGARMMFFTRPDFLRSIFAKPVPHPKNLVYDAMEVLKETFGVKPQAVGLAPATATLFGDFMEYFGGHSICMALPMYIAVLGGRNDSVYFRFKTTSPKIEAPTESKFPVPCVRPLEPQLEEWMNLSNGAVNTFKGHVPGFSAVIHSSIPIGVGVTSCSALQAAIYTFLEGLMRTWTLDPMEKADRCQRSEFMFSPEPDGTQGCSSVRYLPTILGKEGNVLFIDYKRNKFHQQFLDDPRYVFLIASCRRNTSDVTLEELNRKILLCQEAAEILGKFSLTEAEEKHLRCLRKRDASEEMMKLATFVIMEHWRTAQAREAIRNEDYERLGLMMTQSHNSLKDDFGVTSPELEYLAMLALRVEGVLGAKVVGRGFEATIIILVRTDRSDACIRYMRKKYKPRNDKPVFWVTKPSRGAFNIDLEKELDYIP